MEIGVIIAAGGGSTRYSAAGGVRHKLDEDLGGKPVLQRTVELFGKHDSVKWIVVAGPGDDASFAEFKTRHADRLGLMGASLVKGGVEHRWQSVQAALSAIPAEATHIAVHDGARPCATYELIEGVFEMAKHHDAVIPAIDCGDTVKRIQQTDEATMLDDDPVAAILGASPKSMEKLKVVRETLDRAGLVLVQTPQTFKAGVLRKAYQQKDLGGTDDASLVERMGVRVAIAAGDPRNIKITRPEDLALARAIMGVRPPQEKAAFKRF